MNEDDSERPLASYRKPRGTLCIYSKYRGVKLSDIYSWIYNPYIGDGTHIGVELPKLDIRSKHDQKQILSLSLMLDKQVEKAMAKTFYYTMYGQPFRLHVELGIGSIPNDIVSDFYASITRAGIGERLRSTVYKKLFTQLMEKMISSLPAYCSGN